MVRIYIIVEGQSEESSVQGPLAEALWPSDVYPYPIIVGVPGHRGGRTNYTRVQDHLERQLKQDASAFCTTMIDFYGLGKGYPGTPVPQGLTNLQKVSRIEEAVKADFCNRVPHLRPDRRLIPFLTLHEYEGLLFSDPDALPHALNQSGRINVLRGIRNAFSTPEDINNSPDGAPSKRLKAIYPGYKKVIEGTQAAQAVGIARMRQECEHFREWIEQLGQSEPSSSPPRYADR